MKIFKKVTLPRILSVFSILFLTSCMWGATTVPEIYLKQGDIKMELNKEAFGIESLTISRDGQYLLTGDNGGWTMMKGWIRFREIFAQTLGYDAGETDFKAERIGYDHLCCHVA